MQPREVKKDIDLDGRKYRLTKMDPRLACFIFTSLAGRTEESGQLLGTLAKLSRTEFDELQTYALKFVFRIETKDDLELPIPIVGPNGMWADDNLESDPSGVMFLTTSSLMFNIEPFLKESKSTAALLNP